MNWRPIKTAPLNRQVLLAQAPIDHAQVPWIIMAGRWIEVPHLNAVLQAKGQPVGVEEGHWEGGYVAILDCSPHQPPKVYEARSILMHPTHWMPMPQPPQTRKKRRK
jgi:hypothetical protein